MQTFSHAAPYLFFDISRLPLLCSVHDLNIYGINIKFALELAKAKLLPRPHYNFLIQNQFYRQCSQEYRYLVEYRYF